jgi:hypothetical protein
MIMQILHVSRRTVGVVSYRLAWYRHQAVHNEAQQQVPYPFHNPGSSPLAICRRMCYQSETCGQCFFSEIFFFFHQIFSDDPRKPKDYHDPDVCYEGLQIVVLWVCSCISRVGICRSASCIVRSNPEIISSSVQQVRSRVRCHIRTSLPDFSEVVIIVL